LLHDKKIKATFIPPKEDNFDLKNINEEWKDLEDEEFKANQLMLRRNSVQALFNGYYFDYQLAALSQNQAFINTDAVFANNGGKPPAPIPKHHQIARSECQTPKNKEQIIESAFASK
jgi:hypothetical protein